MMSVALPPNWLVVYWNTYAGLMLCPLRLPGPVAVGSVVFFQHFYGRWLYKVSGSCIDVVLSSRMVYLAMETLDFDSSGH